MTQPTNFPDISSGKVRGAKLYANRNDLVADLNLSARPVLGEIGVALGEFSRFLVERFKPSAFHAFDLFDLHNAKELWGQPTSVALQGMSHLEYYRKVMQPHAGILTLHEGLSGETLPKVPSGLFDLIYVDGAHTYDEVLEDSKQSDRCLKRDGVLVFNDYIMYDPFIKTEYGVVQVVNQMVSQGWRVIGFALQKHLFCDIAIARA